MYELCRFIEPKCLHIGSVSVSATAATRLAQTHQLLNNNFLSHTGEKPNKV